MFNPSNFLGSLHTKGVFSPIVNENMYDAYV